MKVVLQQDVKSLGKKGTVVDVKDGFARNFLLPQKKALRATSANLETIEKRLKLSAQASEEDKKKAEAKFKEINQAYEVLSDQKKRQMYDQFGEAAFKGGAPGGASGGQGPFTYSYRTSGAGFEDIFGGGGFSDPFEIFEQFFGGASPFSEARAYQQRTLYRTKIEFMEAAKV